MVDHHPDIIEQRRAMAGLMAEVPGLLPAHRDDVDSRLHSGQSSTHRVISSIRATISLSARAFVRSASASGARGGRDTSASGNEGSSVPGAHTTGLILAVKASTETPNCWSSPLRIPNHTATWGSGLRGATAGPPATPDCGDRVVVWRPVGFDARASASDFLIVEEPAASSPFKGG